MKRTTFIAAIVGTAVAVTGTIAFAERGSRGDHPRPSFSDLDVDGNGQITREEMQARGAARFAKHDTDGDGFLTESEAAAMGAKRASERFAKMLERADANEDGKLSAEEMKPTGKRASRMDKMFKRADADASGGISAEEFAEVEAKMMKRHGKRKKAD